MYSKQSTSEFLFLEMLPMTKRTNHIVGNFFPVFFKFKYFLAGIFIPYFHYFNLFSLLMQAMRVIENS